MPSAKLTRKGRVTVPKRVRELLGVHDGDRLVFRLQEDGTVVVEAEKVNLRSLRGAVQTKVRGVTFRAMNEAIRRGGGRK